MWQRAVKNENITIPVDDNDQYIVYTPGQEQEIRKHLIDVVMKFHILDENGLGSKLTPVVNNLQNKTPIPTQLMADPFIHTVLNGSRKFTTSIYNGSIRQVMTQILNFDEIENRSPEENTRNILASYLEPDDMVNVAIYNDGTIQCACSYCESFFQILEKELTINVQSLNILQQIMVEKYHFLTEQKQ